MTLDHPTGAAGFSFPLDWEGHVVAREAEGMAARIGGVLLAFGYRSDVRPGRRSRNGTYVTYQISVRFPDRAGMQQVLHALAAVPGVMKIL
jgi:putative lipoic acid-binding regulatory protein